MAPELLIEGCEYDHAVDTWAFGVVVYSTLNLGRSFFMEKGITARRRFSNDQWRAWKQGNEEYLLMLVGSGCLTLKERSLVRERWTQWHKKPLPEPQVSVGESDYYIKNMGINQVMRNCLIPMPANGPSGEITRVLT